ncbi:polyprotein [Gossypium arboreum]|uniref:Polyprotein n=1 Tax=Gossypium arboreum TaxID=29729 RepID=A0A0B0MBC6_GOSAR|nr:polyprotein [Gossypium arboreum]
MDPYGKTTCPGLPHTGMSHGRVNFVGLKHDLQGWIICPCLFNNLDHGRVTRACPCRTQV